MKILYKRKKWRRLAALCGSILILAYIFMEVFHLAIFSPIWVQPWYLGGSDLTFSLITDLSAPAVTTILWSDDDRYLLLVSYFNREITVYDTRTWRIVNSIMRQRIAGDENSFVQFFPGSDMFLMPSIGISKQNRTYLQEWDIQKNVALRSFDTWFMDDILDDNTTPLFPDAVAISGNGKVVADSIGNEIHVFDVNSTKIVRVIKCGKYTIPGAVALSEDGNLAIIGGCHPNKVSFFDI